jgi:galactokinase/mevalonate kinase-like predicted kinase
MIDALTKEDYSRVCYLMQLVWEVKKSTSSSIMTKEIEELEAIATKSQSVTACRLIGAGNGGYLLVVSEKNYILPLANLKINLYDE